MCLLKENMEADDKLKIYRLKTIQNIYFLNDNNNS